MPLIDHIINFPNENAAINNPFVKKAGYVDTEDGGWRLDLVLPGLRAYQVTGTETVTDPESGETWEEEIREYYRDWFGLIALSALDQNLRNLPPGQCFLIIDRDRANAGRDDFILFMSPRLTVPELDGLKFDPTFAGTQYPFDIAKPPA